MWNVPLRIQLKATYLIRDPLVIGYRAVACAVYQREPSKKLMDEVTSDPTGLLYQTQLVIVPFTNPLIRLESLSCPGALLGKQTRRQSGSLTFSNFQSNGKQFQPDLSLSDEPQVRLDSLALKNKLSLSFISCCWLLNSVQHLEVNYYTATYKKNGTKSRMNISKNTKSL